MTTIRGIAKIATGPDSVALADRPWHGPAPDEVSVEVHAAGICGTDLHIARDEYPAEPPVTMGHEVSGVVAGLGDGVDASWLGARVVCETYYRTCGGCPWCRDGRRNLCPRRRSLGSFADGGFAPYVVVPVINLHRVPAAVADHAAALAEPLSCVCQCLLDPAVVSTGDRVLVTGPGPMGLLAAQVAHGQGGDVSVAGLPADQDRLAAASRLGFGTLTTAPEPESFDVVIECSGSAAGARAAMDGARRGGRYVGIGIFGAAVTVPLDLLLYKELTMTSGYATTPRSWRRAMTLMEGGLVDLGALVSHVLPLESWRTAFDLLADGKGLKVILDPRLPKEL